MPSSRWVFQCSNQPQRGMAQRDGSLSPHAELTRAVGTSVHYSSPTATHTRPPCRPARLARQPDKLFERLGTVASGRAGRGEGAALSLDAGLLASLA